MDNRIRDIEKNIKDKKIQDACKGIGSIKAAFQSHTRLCCHTNHEIVSKEEETEIRRKTCFQKLLTPTAIAQQSNTSETNYKNQEGTEKELEEEPPDILDTQMAIQSMKYNKSPGIDNIRAELHKKRGGLLFNTLHLEGREDTHGLDENIIVLDQVSANLRRKQDFSMTNKNTHFIRGAVTQINSMDLSISPLEFNIFIILLS